MTNYMQMQANEKIRNIAIIAHVDHGKTTMVDQLLRQGGTFRANQEVDSRVMDNMDLERERGITIAAKNCAVYWNDVKINIIDTPGHADFGGEVERSLKMVDGVVLLVDASEGPLPQTRFVLKKALDADLKIIVCVNKIDRADARPAEVLDMVYDLFIDLDATEDQLDFPVLYSIGVQGIVKESLEDDNDNFQPLYEKIISEIPAPSYDPDQPFQMLVSNLDYSDYLGRLAVGRIFHGSVHHNEQLVCINEEGKEIGLKISKLQVYDGVKITEVQEAQAGDIIILAGIDNVTIGDTITAKDNPKALPRIIVDEPTVSMLFTINTSPLAGKEGKIVQGAKIRERLYKETLRNVAIRVEEGEERDAFIVKGRGELQMAILIEEMRREGFEFTVGRPIVINKIIDGRTMEPIEHLYIDCDENFVGIVTEKLSLRKGRIISMENKGSSRTMIEFSIPSRSLLGYRNEFLTDTRGTGIMNSYLEGYEPYRGDFPTRMNGSLVADRTGTAIPYALFHLEPRGTLFVEPGDPVYEGMVIGENARTQDLDVNPCKEKKASNVRSAGKDTSIILTPVLPMSLERAIDFIREDEMIEITPKSIRLRKAILQANLRK